MISTKNEVKKIMKNNVTANIINWKKFTGEGGSLKDSNNAVYRLKQYAKVHRALVCFCFLNFLPSQTKN